MPFYFGFSGVPVAARIEVRTTPASEFQAPICTTMA